MKSSKFGYFGAGTACLALILGGVTAAQATLAGSTFEGHDGNLIHTGSGTDWDNVAGLNKGLDVPSGSGDNSFGQGTKEDNAATTVVDGSVPPNKNDLSRFYTASELGANGHTYLYLAWERLVNIGNANLDFEINQAATPGFTATAQGPVTLNRTPGDLLVTYDFPGSGTPTLGINTWLTAGAGNTKSECFAANALPCWGKHATLTSASSEGAVNTVAVTDPIPPAQAQLGVGRFGEASIDLTAAGVFPPGTCRAFGSAFIKSRSSSSFTAELKDFIAPIPVSIANCGTITIHKVTENGDSTFNYAPTGNIGTTGFTLSNGGEKKFIDVASGTSSITENLTAAQIAEGWTFESLTCGTVSGASVDINGATVTITMGASGNVDCTYTNHINVSPTIATTLSTEAVSVGGTVHDSAALTGMTSTAGGTVTYTVYTDSACTQGARDAGTVTVTNGVVPDSNALVFNTAGDFYWQAVYSGDADNNGATSVCTSEHLVVNEAQPAVATAQDLIPNDNFTLSGGFSPTGTITFKLYAPSDATCSLAPALTQTVNVTSGNGTYGTTNTTFHATTAGTWRWASTYSGDANNAAVSSACGVENFTIDNG